MPAPLSAYEQRQLQRLRDWRERPPGLVTRGFARAAGPATRAAQALVPVGLLRGALETANELAVRLAARDAVLDRAGVASLQELRQAELERCDRLLDELRRPAIALAAGSGAVAGIFGAAGLVADVPALLTLALRSIHRCGLCYGYDCLEPAQARFAIGVFALASANTLEEKQLALSALAHRDDAGEAAWRDGLERAAQRELSKEAAVFSLHRLAQQLGLNLARRKAAGVLPVLGAAVGGAVNAWYMRDLAQSAQYAFQQRRFIERGQLAAD